MDEDKLTNVDNILKSRTNWAVIGLVYIVVVSLIIMVAFGKTNFAILNFAFSDFLSLLLSFFALGISIAFYFKASDTSNRFYDNTFKFTKDISESIGRMDERFGERLKHMDEGYSKFQDRVFSNSKVIETKEQEITEEESALQATIHEKEAMIKDLVSKATMSQNERDDFLKKLSISETQIKNQQAKLQMLEAELVENMRQPTLNKYILEDIVELLNRRFDKKTINYMLFSNDGAGKHDFGNFLDESLPPSIVEEMRNAGFLTPQGLPTLNLIRNLKAVIVR